MGVFDRVRRLVGAGESPEEGADEERSDAATGLERGADPAGRGRSGVNAPKEGRKSGSHGSHWDTVVLGDDAIMQNIVAAVETGDPKPGRTVDGGTVSGYRTGDGPLGTVVIVGEPGDIWSGYPVGAGIAHEVEIDELIPWANGAEAQLSGQLGEATISFFATNFWAQKDDQFGGPRRVELAAFAYDLGPAEDEVITDDEGNEYSTAGMAGFAPFEGGDVDDYVFQTTVETVTECEFDGGSVYRMRVPLFRGEEGSKEYQVMLYAAKPVCGEYVPEKGDDVAGVLWLQGRLET
ncbi:hypothetical protein [Haloarchaeobius sp. TZWWS8]|uniref:hypothetical protein n=1 Tax=Haloarchaeobius sp. TZWWS8 TaxID=3446121 RepID=UPI003EBFD611